MGKASKRREEMMLLEQRQQAMVKETLEQTKPKLDVVQAALEKETGTKIVAMIQPIGAPIIRPIWEKTPIKCFWETKKVWEEKLAKRLNEVMQKYLEACKLHHIDVFAQVTPQGAQIFYGLTEEKRKEIARSLMPPQPAPPPLTLVKGGAEKNDL